MASLSAILAAVGRLGVGDPKHPSGKDFKVVLDAYLKDKTLNTEVFSTYVNSVSVPLAAMFEGFKQFSADSSGVSKRTVDVIQQAMQVLEVDLKRHDISESERREIRNQVLSLVVEAREEAREHRSFLMGLTYVGVGAVVVVGGVAVYVISGGKNSTLIQKGVGIAGKAAVKAAI